MQRRSSSNLNLKKANKEESSISPNKRSKSLDRTRFAKTPRKSSRKINFNDDENNEIVDNFQNFLHMDDLESRMDLLLTNFFKSNKSRNNKIIEDFEEDEQDENIEERVIKTPRKASQNQIKCDLTQLKICFENIDDMLPASIKKKVENVEKEFHRWTEWLSIGNFNLLIHGIGSKFDLLTKYAESELDEYFYIVAEGFRASVNAKTILQELDSLLHLHIKSQTNIVSWAKRISKEVDEKQTDVFIVLHNIDGTGLREPTHQQALAELAKCEYIHFIASIDHVNGTLIWDESTAAAFHWIRVNISTMKCYKNELLTSNSRLLGLNSNSAVQTHTFSSLDAIWQSLTNNARKTMQKLTECFTQENEALDFFDFYQATKAQFLVSSEVALRKILEEFYDHHIIRKNGNLIYLSVDKDLLISFLENKLENE